MRATAVILVCLALGAAVANAQSLPRPKTGGPTCVISIKTMRCIIDNLSGFVFGIEYGYGNNFRQVCTAADNGAPSGRFGPYVQRQDMQIADAQGIVKVDIMKLAPGVTVRDGDRGKIPAIIFTKYDKLDRVYYLSVCGNNQLYESGRLQIAETYTNPTANADWYLGSFQADCAKRFLFGAAGGAPGDPTAPVFYIKKLKHFCWAPYFHPLQAPPPPPEGPGKNPRPYNEEYLVKCKFEKGKKGNKYGACEGEYPEIRQFTGGRAADVRPARTARTG